MIYSRCTLASARSHHLVHFVYFWCLCWRCGSLTEKKNDNSIPSKETVAAYILEKGEQYAAEQLRGQDRNSVHRSWGDPDAMPSGIWADVWGLDADTTILVFYDAENDDKVERAALGQKGE